MNTDYETYANTKGSHAYDVTVYADKNAYETNNFEQKTFRVFGNSRAVASNRVIRDGYHVHSVNMVG